MIKFYDSISALRAEAIKLGIETSSSRYAGGPNSYSGLDWYNGENIADTLRKSAYGDPSLVPQAEAYINSFNKPIDSSRKVWEPAPAGAFPIVPDFCMGLPTSMRRRQTIVDDIAPINILVCTTSSAGIKAEILAKRGTAILALVMMLSASRPVTLRVIQTTDGTDNGETILVSTINTSPLDLATACYALTSSGFDRRLSHFIAGELNHFKGGWPRGYNFMKNENNPYLTALPERLGFNPLDTLLVSPTYLTDTLVTAPLDWIQTQLDRFTKQNET